MEREVGEAEFE